MDYKKDEILVSVIMPAHNAEQYIVTAMESVCIQQGEFQIELLVIDDASTDKTVEQIEQYKKKAEQNQERHCEIVLLQNEKNLGVAETRNKGIRKARGRYLAFLDADDWWQENKLLCQIKLLEEKQAVLCATARELMYSDGNTMNKVIGIPEKITYQMLLRTNSIPCSSVVMKTEVAREFYMCHDELHEDYILWLKVLKKYGTAYGNNEPMLKSRMSEGGKSRNKIKSAKMQFGVYRYMGLGLWKSVYYFIHYTCNGFKKYS